MSEAPPDTGAAPEQGSGGNILTNKYFGMPGFVWLGGAALLAYFLFFRNKSTTAAATPASSGSTSGETGGTINFVQPQSAPVNTSTGGTSPTGTNNPGQGSQSGTPNPQPTPSTPPSTTSTTTSSTQPAQNNVTVPNVVGQRLATATGMLTAAGLREGGANQVSGVAQTVVSQSPGAGTSVVQGSMVTLRTNYGGLSLLHRCPRGATVGLFRHISLLVPGHRSDLGLATVRAEK